MKTWFTSDQHFNHENIIKFCARPFDNVEHMNEELIKRHNEVVEPDDTVIMLGDYGMGNIEKTLATVKRLNGNKVLLPGNHDRCFVGHGKKAERWSIEFMRAGFLGVSDVTYFDYLGTGLTDIPFTLSHFPYADGKHEDDRYARFRPKDKGGWLLHGHVHEKWKVNGRQINVGVDVWDYRPVDFETLIKTAEAGPVEWDEDSAPQWLER